MKACLYLQRKFAPIGHTIAVHLKNCGVQEFCAYAEPRTAYKFLTSQKEIAYTKILLDDDIFNKYETEKLDLNYLRWLEKEYGLPNLWPYLYLDRVIMNGQLIREYPYNKPLLTHEEMLKTLQGAAKEIISFLKTEGPDFLFMSVISSLGSMLLYQVAKKMGIQTIIVASNRLNSDCIIGDYYGRFTDAEKNFAELQFKKGANPKKNEAIAFIENFRNNPAPYVKELSIASKAVTAKKQFQFLLPKNIVRTIRWIFEANRYYLSNSERDYTDENLLLSVWDKIKRKVRIIRGFSDFYSQPDFKENYAFYPLQLDPEITTMLLAPLYTDQIMVIKQIARSLPVDFKLYVKEHPSMIGFRPRSYYKELTKIPNVKIINPIYESFNLIQNAKLITVLTATTGWEAILMKKPVITFGDIFYNALSMAKRCHSFEELPHLIKSQLETFQHNEEELINFISAVLEDSIKANLHPLWAKDFNDETRGKDEGLKRLAETICRKLKSAPK